MIKTGIVGYGNLGRGASLALERAGDIECVGIFTRRAPKEIVPAINVPVYPVEKLAEFKGKIDVLLLCGGSATDLPSTTAGYLKDFNTVDTFDTHAKIPEYFDRLNKIGLENNTLAGISIGWDPGLFSVARAYFGAVLPDGKDYTFWGKGVSQGHSDAIRRIKGVKNAIQYTIPVEAAVNAVREGKDPILTTREKHTRECFVVAEDGADKERIEREIKEMPNYFSDYDVTVHFISEEELKREHSELPHGGQVIRTGRTGDTRHTLELGLNLGSNPEFTGSVLVAYARAVARLYKEGKRGAVTVLDIPPKYLYDKSDEDLRKTLL